MTRGEGLIPAQPLPLFETRRRVRLMEEALMVRTITLRVVVGAFPTSFMLSTVS
jgi:hypothetical protein